MKSLIGVYNQHAEAIEAIKLLKGEAIREENISLMGKTSVDKRDSSEGTIDTNDPSTEAPLVVGAIAGPVLGVLTGIGIFAIPGLGFIYGAGALVGALAGLDFGLIGGGVVSLLATLGIENKHHLRFKEYLTKGKVILIAKGDEVDIEKALKILHDYNQHYDLSVH